MATPRKKLPIHDLAKLIPAMSDEEFEALCADAEQHGQIEPILLFAGRILDGRHRYRACIETDRNPTTRQFKGSREAALRQALGARKARD